MPTAVAPARCRRLSARARNIGRQCSPNTKTLSYWMKEGATALSHLSANPPSELAPHLRGKTGCPGVIGPLPLPVSIRGERFNGGIGYWGLRAVSIVGHALWALNGNDIRLNRVATQAGASVDFGTATPPRGHLKWTPLSRHFFDPQSVTPIVPPRIKVLVKLWSGKKATP